jgi:TRAP-type transport system small permease protein
MKFLKIIETIQKYFCIFMLVGIVFATALQVFSRYILQTPYMWTEELARAFGFWLVMVGAGIVLKDDEHLGFNVIPERLQAPRKVLTYIVVILFSAFAIKGAMGHLVMSFGKRSFTLPIPLWIFYSCMLVGVLNLLFWSLISLADEVRKSMRKMKKGGLTSCS